jgi:hypothetical protein
MSACPQCGATARPTDRFCNVCGTPMPRASAPAAPAPYAHGAPPPPLPTPGPSPGFLGRPPARCPMGHEIVAGAGYCPYGHPIAPEHATSDPYARTGVAPAPPPPYAPLPPAAPAGFGPPQPPPSPFGMPPAGLAVFAPPPAPPAFAPAPTAAASYGDPPRDGTHARALRGFLVTFGTNATGDFWPLTGGRLVIGRLGSADRIDIALQDPTISSRHAAMLVDAPSGTITIEDTGSTNGTFVNDEHIGFNGRRDLRDGDRLRFGAYTTIVKIIGRV